LLRLSNCPLTKNRFQFDLKNDMKNNIFIRNDLKNWKEYTPVPSAESISMDQKLRIEKIDKLNAGESMYGPSPLVRQRLSRFKGFQFYPDPKYRTLRKEISKYVKVNVQNIFVSNGADELIDVILRLVLNSGEEVIDCPPTFSSYSLSTILNKGVVKIVKREKDFSIDTDAIIKSITDKTKIIFICNPNNPTGNVTPISEIQKILETGVLVCVDEAYSEFGGESAISLLRKYENLIIIRSFSKWAGIAGLRLGYGLMSEYLVKQLMKIKQPYNVNYAAVIAGIASLQDTEYREKIVSKVVKERKNLESEIQNKGGYKVFPSGGNFVYIQTTKKQLTKIKKECNRKKIALRFYDSEITGSALRITVGKQKQNKRIITILNKSI